MKLHKSPVVLTAAAGLVALVVFLVWYRGERAPLTEEEQAYYLEQMQQLTGEASGFIDPEATRELMSSDDGKPFYVVNVFKFREQAEYGDGAPNGSSGFEAFERFRTEILPIWIKNGVHPVFTTTLSGSFVNEWDMVSVVRYRSRRDYVYLQTSSDFLAILPHRMASTEANIRIKLPGILIPSPTFLVLFILFFLLTTCLLVERVLAGRRSR